MTMMQGLSLTGVPLSATAKKRGELSLATTQSHVKVMHQLLAAIYDGLETDGLYDDDFGDDAIKIGKKKNASELTGMFADRCFKLIQIMSEPTQGPVELPVTQILNVLSRGLGVSYSHVLSVPSRTELTSLLPWLHQSCMDVLSQIILCCGRDILPQSHIIIDLCLQTIVSTAKMTSDAKFRTRSSVYQALVLWIRSCGWGQYLTSHRKLLLQELMADIEPDESEKLTQKGEGQKQDPFEGKKKNKKKKKRRGDSYLELEKADDEKPPEISEDRLGVVTWAHSLSQLTVENMPFSIAQSLISHLVQTATTIQRLSQCKPEPYKHSSTRESLYRALNSCLLSRLDFGCNRNDAVSHYQLTNSVVDLLHKACQTDDWKISEVCSQALDGLKLSSRLNGPVIRKVLEFDDSSMEDVGQLMREKEHMEDCVEDLRQKLLKSEMESEQQSRLVASLREQMEKLQCQLSSSREISKDQARISDDNDDSNDDEDMDEDDAKESEGEKVEDRRGISEQKTLDESKHLEKDVTVGENGKNSFNNKKKKNGMKPAASKDTTESGSSLPLNSVTSNKRPNDNVVMEKETKKAKIDLMNQSNNNIDEMLLDFVDAPADS